MSNTVTDNLRNTEQAGSALAEDSWRRFTRLGTPYFFIFGAVVLVTAVLAYPVFYGIYLSFQQTDIFGDVSPAGIQQYTLLFGDPVFIAALRRSLVLVAGTMVLGISFAMTFALVLDKAQWGGRIWRTIVLIPYLISGVAAAVIWRFLFSSTGGLVDPLFVTFGFEPISWLGNVNRAMIVLILANVWYISPFSTLILYAGIKNVDRDLYEAADVDGASAVNKFRFITFPSIAPQFALAVVWLSFASFNMFDIILPLTGGGPQRGTEVLAFLLYQVGFRQLDFNAAAAIMVVLLIFNVIISAFFLRTIRND